MGKGKGHILHKKSAVRKWGRGSHTVCVRKLPLEGGEWEGTHEKQKGRKLRRLKPWFSEGFQFRRLGFWL